MPFRHTAPYLRTYFPNAYRRHRAQMGRLPPPHALFSICVRMQTLYSCICGHPAAIFSSPFGDRIQYSTAPCECKASTKYVKKMLWLKTNYLRIKDKNTTEKQMHFIQKNIEKPNCSIMRKSIELFHKTIDFIMNIV